MVQNMLHLFLRLSDSWYVRKAISIQFNAQRDGY
jgi:hypothetical protein